MPEIVHCAEMPWGESLVAQRGATDGMAHKRLFEGEEDSADNYMLVMSREPNTYFSPRHRHPWDQIRFCLEGKIPIAKGVFVDGGEIAYFPESAHYGPQEGGEDRIVLLLQFGGASGQGFIGPDRLTSARLELERHGRFERGAYSVEAPEGKSNRDAYEAIWEHEKGSAPSYVSPAYKTPIVMRPFAMPWPAESDAGVAMKAVGVFPHRGLTIDEWRLDGGGILALDPSPALRFLFVTRGSGKIDGEDLRRWSAVRLHSGQGARIEAGEGLEFQLWTIASVAGAKPTAET